MIIEVADTEGYQHVRRKAGRFLTRSKGKVRFVIIVDFERKRSRRSEKDSREPGPRSDDGEDDGSVGRVEAQPADVDGDPNKPSGAGTLVAPGKRVAPDCSSDCGYILKKRARVDSAILLSTSPAHGPELADSDPPNSHTLPPAPYIHYSCARVTVLSTKLITHPNLMNKKTRVISTLLDAAECWPCVPGPEVAFRFTWDDMNVTDYPAELRGREFTISFEWLHVLLKGHFGVKEDLPNVESDDECDVVQGVVRIQRRWGRRKGTGSMRWKTR